MRVLMSPNPAGFGQHESGIRRVAEAYARYLPRYGVEFVGPDRPYDIVVTHAGMSDRRTDVAHVHGLYWTADLPASNWEWAANKNVIEAMRGAREVTVPSAWVARTLQRDMRINPHIVPHGIEWGEWQEKSDNGGYVLWNKNRVGDVCSPRFMAQLAARARSTPFVTTFAAEPNVNYDVPNNVRVIGLVPHLEMQAIVRSAAVYLSTTKETFGIGILEAMAAGVPVLGFAQGAILDLVETGVNGYLARPEDMDDLYEGLAYCLKNRGVLGENGRELARGYTWDIAAGQIAKIYERAAEPQRPTVGVVIPAYNYGTEDRLGRAIVSVLNQTYPAEAVVVVDDGSDDNGATQTLAVGYPGVVCIRQDNSGVANARNTGIAALATRYVCCLDADDAIEPDFLRVCVEALEADPTLGIAYTALKYVTPDGKEGISPWPPETYEFDKFLQRQNQVPTCCVFRREMWSRLYGYRQRYAPNGAGAEDAEFWLRGGSIGFRGARVTGAGLFVYSMGGGRVSGNPEYREVDWLAWHPWVKDGLHPVMSLATPNYRFSHPVRQYDEPIISVVIPCAEAHVTTVFNALDSLEAQTFRRWEAIVVFDGVTEDDAGVGRLLKGFPYVTPIFSPKGHGAGWARNRGAERASGKLLLFLDADDYLYPDALQRMLDAWNVHGEIVYTDYHSRAFLDADAVRDSGNRIIARDEKSGECLVDSHALSYDCERAVAQPQPNPYIWCLVSSLTPRAWHRGIGGFDESMESWEDWDYWLRMARAGRCFYHLQEPLAVYKFYTGIRRMAASADTSQGKQKARYLIQYMQEKYSKEAVMACGGCGGSRPAASAPSTVEQVYGAASISERAGLMGTDTDFVEIIYQHPNQGDHQVIGPQSRINYGRRKPGEAFLVRKDDIYAMPDIFVVRQEVKDIEEPVTPPPEPKPIVKGVGTTPKKARVTGKAKAG